MTTTSSPQSAPLSSDYPAADTWPDLNALDGHGFGDYDLPTSDALVGRRFDVDLEDGARLSIELEADQATWTEAGTSWRLPVSVTELEAELFVLHSAVDTSVPAEVVAWVAVIDTRSGAVTAVRSHIDLTEGRSGPAVVEDVRSGALDGTSPAELHSRSSDLVGRRVLYVYGPDNAYEHFYLHDNAYSWHCLAGAERGLADTDRGRVWRLREDVYLFTWQEKVVPCEGVVAISFRQGQSTGRIWGWDTGTGRSNSIAMGAREVELSRIQPDPALWV